MNEKPLHDYKSLKLFTDKLVQRCASKQISLSAALDSRQEQLGNSTLLHTLIDVYEKTSSEEEKKNLLSLAEFILSKGANPNCKNKDSVPLLHRAISIKSIRLVALLRKQAKLDYSIKQHDGHKTALEICIKKWPNNLELIKHLSSKNSNEIQEIFMEAISEKDIKKLKYLINNRLIDINLADSNGLLPLNLLCVISDIKFFDILIELLNKNGYVINFKQQDKYGYTPLHLACNKWNKPKLPIIRWLIQNGVDPSCPNNKGDTALHEIVELGDPTFIEELLKHGAKADQLNNEKFTPLTKMRYRPDLVSHVECVTVLEKQGTGEIRSVVIDPLVLEYQKGFWIRLLGAYCRDEEKGIDREIEILEKRESFSDNKLFVHNPKYDVEKHPELSYSPATFVKAGIPIGLFGDGFGVVIQTDRLIPAWCSGLNGQVMTDRGNDVNFNAEKLSFNYAEVHQSSKVKSSEIALQYQALYEQYRSRGYSPKESYEAIVDPNGLPYNEGLFRYKRSEISAIYLACNPKSAFYAIKFYNKLGLDTPFCTYDSAGKIVRLPKEKVIELSKDYNPEEQDEFNMLFAQEPHIPDDFDDIFPAQLYKKSDDLPKTLQAPASIKPENKSNLQYTHGASTTVIFKPAASKQSASKTQFNPAVAQKKEGGTSIRAVKK